MNTEAAKKLILECEKETPIFNLAFVYFNSTLPVDAKHPNKAVQKATQCYWFYHLAEIKPTLAKRFSFESKKQLLIIAIAALNEIAIGESWQGWKLNSIAALSKHTKPFKYAQRKKISLTEAFDSVLNGRVGNKNSQLLGLEQQAILINRFLSKKSGIKSTHRKYTAFAQKMVDVGLWSEKSLVSRATIRNFLNQPLIKHLKSEHPDKVGFTALKLLLNSFNAQNPSIIKRPKNGN